MNKVENLLAKQGNIKQESKESLGEYFSLRKKEQDVQKFTS